VSELLEESKDVMAIRREFDRWRVVIGTVERGELVSEIDR